MAQLNNRDDNFISTLIAVSGRVRPSDMHSVGAAEASELLRAYQAAHPEMALGFDGDVLVQGFVAAPSAPAPAVPAPFDAPVAAAAPEFAPAAAESFGADGFAAAPQPAEPYESTPVPYAPPTAEGGETLPAWVYESPESTAGADLSEIPAPVPSASELSMAGDFEPLPEYEGEMPSGEPLSRMAWWWWVVAALFFPLGGLIGYLVVNKSDPKGARNLLFLTAGLFLLAVVLGVLFFVFGLGGALAFWS